MNEVLNFEGYKDALNKTGLITLIKEEIEKLKQNDIKKYKEEISKLILSDLVVRYYYKKGRIEAMIKFDKTIEAALQTLESKEDYNKILKN